jgi:hypothetical protein
MKKTVVLLACLLIAGCNLLFDPIIGTWRETADLFGPIVGVPKIYTFNTDGTVKRDGEMGAYTKDGSNLVLTFGGITNSYGYSISGNTMTWTVLSQVVEVLARQ